MRGPAGSAACLGAVSTRGARGRRPPNDRQIADVRHQIWLIIPFAKRLNVSGDWEGEASAVNVVLAPVPRRHGGTHDLIRRQPSAGNLERWRREMTVADRELFESIAAAELESLSYPLEGRAVARAGLLHGLSARTDAVLAALGPNTLKRRLKDLLPLVCWLRTWRN